MGEHAHNLLEDRLITVRTDTGREELSLPGVLASLLKRRIQSFFGLQAHQEHAWHAFLVQLAALACHGAGVTAAAASEADWRGRLLGLTGGSVEPWCLVVGDLAKPAFLQPPVPEGSLAGFKGTAGAPDSIDILNTAKNHDVKAARVWNGRPEHWIYALVTLQTMQGYLGRGNYGIARMNGGFSSRPAVGLQAGDDPRTRFRRDLQAVLASRIRVLEQLSFARTGGSALLWLEPWDGATQLSLERCDPWFIEVCRRVRIELTQGRLKARLAPSKVARIASDDVNGVTGDPWTPIHRGGNKALTVSGAGFTYRLLQEILLSGDFAPGAALEIQADDPEQLSLRASVLVRGQGVTEGFHERELPIPGKVRLRLGSVPERERLGKLAKARMDSAGDMQNQVLKPAICALLQAGADKLDFRDDRAKRWIEAFDDRVDRVFFEQLWNAVETDPGEADHTWRSLLWTLADEVVAEAKRSTPIPAARRFRAEAAADRIMGAARRKWLSEEAGT